MMYLRNVHDSDKRSGLRWIANQLTIPQTRKYFQIINGILIPNKKYKIHSRTETKHTDSLKNRNKEIRKIRKYKIHLRIKTKNTENTEEQNSESFWS